MYTKHQLGKWMYFYSYCMSPVWKNMPGAESEAVSWWNFNSHTALTQLWHCPSEFGDRCLENTVSLSSAADLPYGYVQHGNCLIFGPFSVADWLPCPPFRAMHVTENGVNNNIKSELLPGLVAELRGLEKKKNKMKKYIELKKVLYHHLTFCHPKSAEYWQ